MFGLKVIALLALAFVASATDLDVGMAIMACARRAINGGVPELGIPTHDPYVVLNHLNFNWTGDLGVLSNATIQVHNMTWAGLATWNLTATQGCHCKNCSHACFDFELCWKHMELAGKYDAEENELMLHQEQHGNFSLVWKESKWTGNINVTKPNEISNGTVNNVTINWSVEDVDVTLNGLGMWDTPTAFTIGASVKAALNNHLIGNAVGDFIKTRLSTIWWNTGKVWELTKWCQDHPAN